MQILSSEHGRLNVPMFQRPASLHHVSNYVIASNVSEYTLLNLSATHVTAWNIEATTHKADTLTITNDNPALCLFLSLTNSVQCNIAGIRHTLLLHENFFSAFFLPLPHIELILQNQNHYSVFALLVTPEWLQKSFSNKPTLLNKPYLATPNIRQYITEIASAQVQTLFTAICLQLIETTLQLIEQKPATVNISMKDAAYIYKVKHYIDKNYKDKLTLSILAQNTEVSEHIIKTYFKEIYNKSHHDYINEKKIDYSRSLLIQGLKIADIANEIHLDTKTFKKLFEQRYNITPKQYQKKNGNFR